MMNRATVVAVILIVAALLSLTDIAGLAVAQTPVAPALTGRITSQSDGPMEGVLVGAKKVGSTIAMNVQTGEFTEYLLPHETNVRHVEVQKSGSLSTFWLGDQHGNTVIRVEPLTP